MITDNMGMGADVVSANQARRSPVCLAARERSELGFERQISASASGNSLVISADPAANVHGKAIGIKASNAWIGFSFKKFESPTAYHLNNIVYDLHYRLDNARYTCYNDFENNHTSTTPQRSTKCTR